MPTTPTTSDEPTLSPAPPVNTARRLLWQTIAGQWRVVVAAAAVLMTWQACESLVPVAIGAVIDRVIASQDGSAALRWAILFAALFTVLSLSFRFGSRLARRASEQASHLIRVRVAEVVLDPRTRPDPSRRTGVLVSVASSDCDRVGQLCAVLAHVGGALVSLVVAGVALLRISVPLGLLVLLGAPPMLALVHLLGGPLERRSRTEQQHAAEAADLATDLVRGLRVLKGIGGEISASARYARVSQRSRIATVRAAKAEATYDAMTLLLTMSFLALVALVGGRFATQGRISVGDLVAAVGLAQFLLGPLGRLSSVGPQLARARASAARVVTVLNASRRENPADPPSAPSGGALSIRTDGLLLDVPQGELLGIVADEADAERLVHVLATAWFADHGEVRVDDVPLTTLDAQAARRTVLVARHDAHLFAEPVRDAIGCGAGRELVRAAIEASDTAQVLDTLPDGLETLLSERGSSLSGGQHQRVALARAFAADPVVLVLQDPTTAVDAATEQRIAQGLRRLRRGRTTVVTTTSPALLSACDRVLLLTAEGIRAEGTHEQLAATQAAYRDLVMT